MAAAVLPLGGYAFPAPSDPSPRAAAAAASAGIDRFAKTKLCPRCLGKKLGLRVGRRAHNAWRRTHQAGAR